MIDDLIYDVGMNNGDDTAYYLHRGYRVVAIDADPQACENARQRFREELSRGRVSILNVGITAEPGTCDFWVCEPHPQWSSFDRRIAARDGSAHHRIQVACRTLDSILAEHGVPYYLKVDIEGHDLECVDGLKGVDDRPRYISIELDRCDESLRKLAELGYTAFKCVSQFTFISLEYPPTQLQKRVEFWQRLLTQRDFSLRLARKAIGPAGRRWIAERYCRTHRRNGWIFNDGSSGPFGEDTPGTWLTAEQMRDVYHHYRQLCDQGKPSIFWNDHDYSFWVDLHARREG